MRLGLRGVALPRSPLIGVWWGTAPWVGHSAWTSGVRCLDGIRVSNFAIRTEL